MKRKKIYTFRPYYIDTERLYDMYSTVMDGYSDEEEVVDIVRCSSQTSRKKSGTFEFAVSSNLQKNNKINTSQNIAGSFNKERNHLCGSEMEYQRTTTRKLSQCVLLNWMLDRMENDHRFLEANKNWLMSSLRQPDKAIGMPVRITGRIFANSPAIRTNLRIYPKGLRGIWQKAKENLPSKSEQRSIREKKYILTTKNNRYIDSILQQIQIDIVLAEELLPSSTPKSEGFISDVRDVLHSLEVDIQKNLNTQSDKFTSAELINTFLQKHKSNLGSNPSDQNGYRLFTYIEQISNNVDAFHQALDIDTRDSILNKILIKDQIYIFNLREQMLYDTTYSDILTSTQIKCLGIITGIGKHCYTIEVVALYR